MKFMAILLLVSSSLAYSRILTPDECEELIRLEYDWHHRFYLHVNAQQGFYLQDRTYGVLSTNNKIHMKLSDEIISTYPYWSNFQIPIIFGYGLRGNDKIPEWNGLPNASLYCISSFQLERGMLDICCLCDESEIKVNKTTRENSPMLKHNPPQLHLPPSYSPEL